MRAITVCVDYWDYARVTIPYNRQHFNSVTVVTTREQLLENSHFLRQHHCDVVATDLFYAHGASFNKWAALEHGLNVIGRFGWMTLMDVDVLWPADLRIRESEDHLDMVSVEGTFRVKKGQLCTPYRRMFEDMRLMIPREGSWRKYLRARNQKEWAGYSQIFHADDPALPEPPWHEVNWRHAGGADSFFQDRWRAENKVRPPWEVLHLGQAGVNWCGRSSRYLDGTIPERSEERISELAGYVKGRRGRTGKERFDHEKL